MRPVKEILAALRRLREKPDDDNVRYKQIIKKKLMNDDMLIYLLNNKEFLEEEREPEDYFGVNILPYYVIPETQHNVQNFVCFETSSEEVSRGNSAMKIQQVIFYILCHTDTNVVEDVGSARHDLIAALLKKQFQGCNDFGQQLKLISDKSGVVDTNYASRTLVFEQISANSLLKDGKTINLRRGY